MKANVTCISCIIKKQEQRIRRFPDEEKKSAYMHDLLKLLYEHGREESAPWLSMEANKIYERYFVEDVDYRALKHKYNQLMLSQEKALEAQIRESQDAIRTCIKYVCAGNYIDFSAVDNVNENMLEQLLIKAASESVPEETYQKFLSDLEQAHHLLYITDNCGEIVLDKLFIRLLQEIYPYLEMTVLVRGEDVLNDATLEDAKEVGLFDIVRCIGNGCGMPGTVVKDVSAEAKAAIGQADVIISKGQGNFESLYGSGLNPYYLFLCKCELFVRRFGLKQYASVFAKEEDIVIQF